VLAHPIPRLGPAPPQGGGEWLSQLLLPMGSSRSGHRRSRGRSQRAVKVKPFPYPWALSRSMQRKAFDQGRSSRNRLVNLRHAQAARARALAIRGVAMPPSLDVVAVVVRGFFALTPRRVVKGRQTWAETKPSSCPRDSTDRGAKAGLWKGLMHRPALGVRAVRLWFGWIRAQASPHWASFSKLKIRCRSSWAQRASIRPLRYRSAQA